MAENQRQLFLFPLLNIKENNLTKEQVVKLMDELAKNKTWSLEFFERVKDGGMDVTKSSFVGFVRTFYVNINFTEIYCFASFTEDFLKKDLIKNLQIRLPLKLKPELKPLGIYCFV